MNVTDYVSYLKFLCYDMKDNECRTYEQDMQLEKIYWVVSKAQDQLSVCNFKTQIARDEYISWSKEFTWKKG